MLKWYKKLYVGDTAKKKEKKIIRKINSGAGQLGVYVITLAVNRENHLEIFSANILLQKPVRSYCPMIVGIARGYDEAVAVVQEITEEVYQKTGAVDIRAFLESDLSTRENRWNK